jgi:hypothetical protein
MKYLVQMTSGDKIYMRRFMTINSGVQLIEVSRLLPHKSRGFSADITDGRY